MNLAHFVAGAVIAAMIGCGGMGIYYWFVMNSAVERAGGYGKYARAMGRWVILVNVADPLCPKWLAGEYRKYVRRGLAIVAVWAASIAILFFIRGLVLG